MGGPGILDIEGIWGQDGNVSMATQRYKSIIVKGLGDFYIISTY